MRPIKKANLCTQSRLTTLANLVAVVDYLLIGGHRLIVPVMVQVALVQKIILQHIGQLSVKSGHKSQSIDQSIIFSTAKYQTLRNFSSSFNWASDQNFFNPDIEAASPGSLKRILFFILAYRQIYFFRGIPPHLTSPANFLLVCFRHIRVARVFNHDMADSSLKQKWPERRNLEVNIGESKEGEMLLRQNVLNVYLISDFCPANHDR